LRTLQRKFVDHWPRVRSRLDPPSKFSRPTWPQAGLLRSRTS